MAHSIQFDPTDTSSNSQAPKAKQPGSASNPLWYKDALIYELHVRSFSDSNGDGIGDFPGLTSRLDYLQELGVTCLWILPFFPSPLRDDGYDIAEYTAVNPAYGTIDDFTAFIDAAHARGMQVLIELVMNHTSDRHPWFERARRAPAGSVERNFYVWSKTKELFADARIIFNDTETSNWAWDDVAGEYYWHRFFSHQPDLNYDNPAVLEEMFNVVRFWLDRGVDGLRLDAIPYLVERDRTNCENLPESHEIIRKVRALMDSEYTNRFLLAEANQWPSDVRPYFGNGDECHMAFHFPLMPRIYVALRQEDRQPICDIMQQTPDIPPTCQWGLFLRNHDELTLEMVTQDERDYMYLAYSADPRMRINLGIRRRLAPLLDNNRSRIELLNSLLLSFPGTPILYYGDEIGMGDNIELGDRNGVRTPMQWSDAPFAGFSSVDPALHGDPVISDPVYGYQAVNVKEQLENPSSLLQWTRKMLHLRQIFPVFGRGTLRFLTPDNTKVLAYLRELDDERVLCLANLSRFAQPVTLDLSEFVGCTPVEMLGYTPFPPIAEGHYNFTLSPYASLWFELQQKTTKQVIPFRSPAAEASQEKADPNYPFASVLASARASTNESPRLLLASVTPTPEWLFSTLQTLVREVAQQTLPYRVTLAYPQEQISAQTTDAAGLTAKLAAAIPTDLAPAIELAPFSHASGASPFAWPHSAQCYFELSKLADERQATALMISGGEEDLGIEDRAALANAILVSGCDLAMPVYKTSRYEGLVNTSILHPITLALYDADVRYPLAADIAVSIEFLRHLGSLAAARSPGSRDSILGLGFASTVDEKTLWPATEAMVRGFRTAQVQVGVRHFHRPPGIGFTELMTRILDSLFAETDRNAGYWQRNLPPQWVLNVGAEEAGNQAAIADDDGAVPRENIDSMLDSFMLATTHLQEVWSQALSPGTMLALKRLGARSRDSFSMPDSLWARIVYEFLATYHNRTVNRQHISGALVSLYYGWAASYLMQIPNLTAEELDRRSTMVSDAFRNNKQYLISLWRWPDRFTP